MAKKGMKKFYVCLRVGGDLLKYSCFARDENTAVYDVLNRFDTSMRGSSEVVYVANK